MKLKKQVKQHLREQLWLLLEDEAARPFGRGICDSVTNIPDYTFRIIIDEWLKKQFKKWPEFSGDRNYPVKPPKIFIRWDGKKGDAEEAFYDLPYWEGEYGESRIRLVMFLIQQLDP